MHLCKKKKKLKLQQIRKTNSNVNFQSKRNCYCYFKVCFYETNQKNLFIEFFFASENLTPFQNRIVPKIYSKYCISYLILWGRSFWELKKKKQWKIWTWDHIVAWFMKNKILRLNPEGQFFFVFFFKKKLNIYNTIQT